MRKTMRKPTSMLFSRVKSAAKALRTKNKHADGLAFWKPIKNALEPFDAIKAEWNPRLGKDAYVAFHDRVMKLRERDANGRMIEPHHFIIQCVRIPKTEELTLRKLVQVALNIGQLMPMMDELPPGIARQFRDLKMHMMGTYIKDTSAYDKVVTNVTELAPI